MSKRGAGERIRLRDAASSQAPDNALGVRQREGYLRRCSRLVRLSREVLAAQEVGDLLQRAVDAARDLTGARIGIAGHDYHEGVFRIGATSRAAEAPSCPEGVAFAVRRGGVYMRLIEDAATIRLTEEELTQAHDWWGLPEEHAPLRGLLGARLTTDGLPGGLIMVSDKENGGQFTPEDEALLEELAAIASLGLHHLEAREQAHRLSKTLSDEKERLAVTLRSIGDGVIATDRQGRVTLMNDVAASLTGWSEQEAVGRPLPEVFHIVDERTGERVSDPVEKALAANDVVGLSNHTALIARDGSRHVLADSAAPIRDPSGSITGVVLVFQDVTERRQFEEELARANKLESLGLLAGGIAHDFNNLLTGILGNVVLARMEAAPRSEQAEVLAEAEEAAVRAKDLTQQLLTFAKGGTPVRRMADLREVLEESCRFALRGSSVRCRMEVAADLWPVEIDRGQMAQVVQNLVINAQEAMPSGGTITLSAHNAQVNENDALPLPPGRYIEMVVADEGVGIPPEYIGRIFDPYFTTKEHGSGIGLFVCYSVVNKHEGCITVDSQVGVGTRFSVYMPAANEEQRPLARRGDRGKVLVMDDEEVVRRVNKRVLEKLGYRVELASDSPQAIQAYRGAQEAGEPFDAVLLDLVVPGGPGGRECLAALKGMDPEVRAIVSSGYSTDPAMLQCRRYGFVAAVGKPCRLEELEVALRLAVGR